jgi:hypothetical protein
MVIEIELSRFSAVAPPWNAVGFLFRSERHRRMFPDPISVVRFKSSAVNLRYRFSWQNC